MASSIPSVIVALTVVGVLLGILGGIVQYYSMIYYEPLNLPAYGTIYVKDVDQGTYTVKIVNTFGQSVRALFTVYVSGITPPPRTPYNPIVTFWADIRPGEIEINLLDRVRENPPALGTSYTIDLTRSYFIVGNLKYPLVKGAGALKPPQYGSGTVMTFSANGLGTLYFGSVPYDRYGSLTFKDTRISISSSISAPVGYYRSVYDYEVKTKVRRYDYGIGCVDCSYIYSGGYWNGTACVSCTERISCDSTRDATNYNYIQFECAYDGGATIYYVPLSTSFSTKLNTIALKGQTLFTMSNFAVDSVAVSGPPTSYNTSKFPYILPNQGACNYYYSEYKHVASIHSYTSIACDPRCGGGPVTESVCYESTYFRFGEWRWGCDSKKCAGLNNYIYAKISGTNLNVTSFLTEGVIHLRFNLTYIIDYYFVGYNPYNDPELADSYVRIGLINPIALDFPGLAGYIGIRYDEELKSASVTLQPSIRLYSAYVKALNAKYTATIYPSISTSPVTLQATTTPVGYVAISTGNPYENAKTYSFETQNPSLSINIATSWNTIMVPIKGWDTIYVEIVFDLYITPTLTIQVQVTS